MSKEFVATTRIKYGERVESKDGDPTKDRKNTKWFEVGQVVTGLDKKTMAQLWDAGALEERDSSDSSSETSGSEDESGSDSEGPSPAVVKSPGAQPTSTTDTVIVPTDDESKK
jgi:hypothetical protein